MTPDSERDDASQISTDRETIRAWADSHDAAPVAHPEEERYRIVTEEPTDPAHERMEWEDFHGRLDEDDYVVIYHGETETEPFEVTEREDALTRSNVENEDLEERLIGGETVTSTVTETSVVEEVVVEEATVESELVDTTVTDDRVVDVELVSREVEDCRLDETGTVDDREWFDADRYMDELAAPASRAGGATGTPGRDADDLMTGEGTEPTTGEPAAAGEQAATDETGTAGAPTTEETSATGMTSVEEEYPFTAEIDVAETWAVTREFAERFTVESRIEDVDVAESDAVTDRDVDVEGLQHSIVEGDVIDLETSSDDVMSDYEVETEFNEDDRIHTHLTRTRIVEDEVVDRQRVRADVTAAELLDMERIATTEVATEVTEDVEAGGTAGESAAATEATGDERTAATATGGEGPATGGDEGSIPLSDDEIGKDVVDDDGETIGMVTDVADDGTTMYVDAEPGITEKIKAALDWGDADEDDFPVEVEQIDHVTREEVRLKGAEELEEISPPA